MKASKRLRKVAGATAAVMAASNWVGLSASSRNADAIVPLSDQIMAQVSGGQSTEVKFSCFSAATVSIASRLAAAITGGGLTVAVPLPLAAICAGYAGEAIVVEPFYQSTFLDVYTGFLVMGGYIQNMVEVDGVFQCVSSDCTTPTIYSATDDSSYYCGSDGCWCDWDDDCWSYWCDGGYCIS